MLAGARRRGAELGLDNVEYRQIDAERIPLDDDAVDGVLCQNGYMLLADPAAAFAGTRRVLRPGGRLAFAVWSTPDHNPWGTLARGVLVERGHLPPPEPGAPGPFALGDDASVRALLDDAGFAGARVAPVEVRFVLDSLEEWERWASEATSIGEALRGVPEDERAAIRADVAAVVRALHRRRRARGAAGPLERVGGVLAAVARQRPASRPGRGGDANETRLKRTRPTNLRSVPLSLARRYVRCARARER